MARPNLKSERRSQIIDACEICFARYGVEGTTLDRVAEEAGLARPLIRHNVGNRDELIAATVERFIERSDDAIRRTIDALPRDNRIKTLIDWLFDPAMSDSGFTRVSDALTTAAANDPALARTMRDWTRRFVSTLAEVIDETCPGIDAQESNAVAAGMTAAYFMTESVSTMGPMTDIRSACKEAAIRLADTLPVSR